MIRLVDTSVLIPASRGVAGSVDALSRLSGMFIPQTAIGEFLVGVLDQPSRRARAGEAWLNELLLDATVLPADLEISRGYARLWRHTHRTGRPIPQNDVWIAATGAAKRLVILTRDHHFRGLPGVEVELLED